MFSCAVFAYFHRYLGNMKDYSLLLHEIGRKNVNNMVEMKEKQKQVTKRRSSQLFTC